jgi:hypothetical protein
MDLVAFKCNSCHNSSSCRSIFLIFASSDQIVLFYKISAIFAKSKAVPAESFPGNPDAIWNSASALCYNLKNNKYGGVTA